MAYRIHKRTIKKQGKEYAYYALDCGRDADGRRKFIHSKTQSHLKAIRSAMIEDQRRLGDSATALTIVARTDAIKALEQLQGRASLQEAVAYWVEHHAAPEDSGTVLDLLPEYVNAKRTANRRPRTVRDIDAKVRRFAERSPDQPIAGITSRDIQAWLDAQSYSGRTRQHHRTILSGFFSYVVKQGIISRNPVDAVPTVTIDQPPITIFSPAQVDALLRAAATKHPEMLPYFAVGIFAGLRPENELQGLDWRDINLEARVIRVRPYTAKRRRQRLVDISDNLAAWLVAYRATGQLVYMRKRAEAVRKVAEVPWGHDIMRHSFGSYYLARTQDAPATALQMGHVSTDILFGHYRELVAKAETEAFWKIQPGKGKVIRFRAG